MSSSAPSRRFTSTPAEPYDRGVEFGRVHAAQVARTVDTYRALWSRRAQEPFDVDRWGARALAVVEDAAPAAADEIRGIAQGAGLPVVHVAAINARTELLAIADPTRDVECSTVVALPPAGDVVAIQTWDWYEPMSDGWLTWTIPYPDGRRVETVTEYGVLAKIGVNDAGFGLMLNMLHHTADDQRSLGDRARVGFPVHLLSRRLLERARTVAEAEALVAQVAEGPHGFSASTSLTVVHAGSEGGEGAEGPDGGADAAGGPAGGRAGGRCGGHCGGHPAASSVELFPGGPGVVRPQPSGGGALLVRTNHFVSDAGAPGDIVPAKAPGSLLRRTVLLERLEGRADLALHDVLAAMEHHDVDGPVCSHPDPGVDAVVRHATLATVHVDVLRRRLGVTEGGPCGAGVVPLAVA